MKIIKLMAGWRQKSTVVFLHMLKREILFLLLISACVLPPLVPFIPKLSQRQFISKNENY